MTHRQWKSRRERTVSALDARRRLGELLESVYHRGDEVIIERAG
ncbi:MAG: type II toxin-antitoxin system prevent-host-death family antitoxin [Chloroflexi bacterium]|nr:type II toxin-antitoxin system prevent-host-death family antitoxin [Chloroflexota bacterium]